MSYNQDRKKNSINKKHLFRISMSRDKINGAKLDNEKWSKKCILGGIFVVNLNKLKNEWARSACAAAMKIMTIIEMNHQHKKVQCIGKLKPCKTMLTYDGKFQFLNHITNYLKELTGEKLEDRIKGLGNSAQGKF